MFRCSMIAAVALAFTFAPVQAGDKIVGQYLEARTCDVWTGPCFANADFNLTGKNAVLAWKIESGSFEDTSLNGLTVVAVISAQNTLGLEQLGNAKAVLILDEKASVSQREALVRFVQKQAGKLVGSINKVHAAPIVMNTCECKGQACYELDAGVAKVRTRCLDQAHDKACGNESAFYPPLVSNVNVRPAAAVEHIFRGTGLRETYSDYDRRGAYVGSFETK